MAGFARRADSTLYTLNVREVQRIAVAPVFHSLRQLFLAAESDLRAGLWGIAFIWLKPPFGKHPELLGMSGDRSWEAGAARPVNGQSRNWLSGAV